MALTLINYKEKEKIATDIDDTILDFVGPFLADYNIRHKTNFRKENLVGYTMDEVFEITPEKLQHELNTFYNTPGFLNLPLIEGAEKAIDFLGEKYLFPAVTTRPPYLNDKTRKNLSLYFNGALQGIRFTPRDEKAHRYMELEPRAIIDDDIKTLLQIPKVKGIEALLVDQPWNQHPNLPKNITRVGNWRKEISPWPEITERLK